MPLTTALLKGDLLALCAGVESEEGNISGPTTKRRVRLRVIRGKYTKRIKVR
jgi:hypothetical protein